jgi:hypothetical protein
MWRWAALNDKSMFPYLQIPGYPNKNPDTSTGQHTIKFRVIINHHLYMPGVTSLKTGKSKEYIALHHFPAWCCENLKNNVGTKKQFRWRVPLDIRKQYGLNDNDMCKSVDGSGKMTFYCCPIQQMSESCQEVAEAEERHRNSRQNIMNPAIPPAPFAANHPQHIDNNNCIAAADDVAAHTTIKINGVPHYECSELFYDPDPRAQTNSNKEAEAKIKIGDKCLDTPIHETSTVSKDLESSRPGATLTEQVLDEIAPPIVDSSTGEVVHIEFSSGRKNTVLSVAQTAVSML